MRLPPPYMRLVRPDVGHESAAQAPRIVAASDVPPRSAHTPEAPILIALGLLLIAALVWVLWGVALIRDGGPNVSGLGVPPDVEEPVQ